jgi:peptide/nickel transport system permease protein
VADEVFKAVGNTLHAWRCWPRSSASCWAASFGFVAGYFRNSWLDQAWPRPLSVLGVSVPHYWLGMVLVIVFSSQLNWLPRHRARARRLGRSGPGTGRICGIMMLPALTMSRDPDGDHRAHRARASWPRSWRRSSSVGLRAKGLTDCGVFLHVVKNAAPTGAGGDGAAARLPAGRLHPDRDRVRLAGHRASCWQLPSSSATCRCCRARSWCWRCSS